MRSLGGAIATLLLCTAVPAAAQDHSRAAAAAAAELRSMCQEDQGRLWGQSLCGPLLVADATTRSAWASQADAQGLLQAAGQGWTGTLPQGVGIANTSLDWAGVRWIMIVAPLPEDPAERRVLVAHEAWHRIQASIGLAAIGSDCAHLETERGRYLLRLEMRALSTALRSRARARSRAARDALTFRAARLTEFPPAASQEAALDRNEGLASYTGVKLGTGDGADVFAARTLDQYDSHDAYARAYAYATGPAYGLLLDDLRPEWRSQLAAYAPADLLAMALSWRAPSPRNVRRAADRYGAPALREEERNRAEAQRARVTALRVSFEGPRLELPLSQMRFEFDPNQVTPIEGVGNVYRTLTLRDRWGEIRATEGALIDPTFTRLTAAAPNPNGLSGPGWRLTLNPGFRLIPTLGGALSVEAVPTEQ